MEVTSNMMLRLATPADASDIARVHVTTWQVGYAGIVPDTYLNALSIERHTEIWRKRIEVGESELWLIEKGGVTAGWIAFGIPRAGDSEPNSAEIYAVYVAPTCWSRGMGRALLSCAVERLSARGYTSCHLWVLVENVRSRRFYELAGFSAVPSSVKLIDIGTASLPEIRYRRSLGMRSKLVWDIRVDDLSSDAVRDLVRMHLEGMHAHSPAESVFALNLSGLTASYVTVWTAWHGGAIAGMGALKDLGGHVGEIKSMRTHPNFLRRGVASALLDHIIDVARSKAMVRLSLETGTGSYFEPALTLYRRRGFVDGNEFADYKRSAFNQFLHLTL